MLIKNVIYCLFIVALFLGAQSASAQIAEECAGVVAPDDYSEATQQAFLQNYFGLATAMTSMKAPVPFAKGQRAVIGFELGALPRLVCQRRFVLGGTKTEDTNKLPAFPRPRVTVRLPNIGKFQSYVEAVGVPPLKTPFGTILHVGTEIGGGYLFDSGLSVGARAHLSMAHLRAEIATPFDEDDPAFDDLYTTSTFGGEVAVGYTPAFAPWVTPYFNIGMADLSSLFIVGDNLAIVQNTEEAWWGMTSAIGTQMVFWDHLLVNLEGSVTIPFVLGTGKIKVGYIW